MAGHDETLTTRDRFRGALLGLAVGEAMGAPAEFLTADQIMEKHGFITEMIGGGINDVAADHLGDEPVLFHDLVGGEELGGRAHGLADGEAQQRAAKTVPGGERLVVPGHQASRSRASRSKKSAW